jgi:hypothetical protein
VGSGQLSVYEGRLVSVLSVRAWPPLVGAAIVKIALSAVAWFLAVAWHDLSRGPQEDSVLTVISGFFIMFLTLLLHSTPNSAAGSLTA